MREKKLYAVLLGGRAEGCHIELHDVVFVVGERFEDTYPSLVNKWFGCTKRLHIDSSVELSIVDGYKINLSLDPPSEATDQSLYFTNFGGYQKGVFGEVHDMKFYVGENKKHIVKRASQELCVGSYQQHCDDNLLIGAQEPQKDIDDIIKVACVDNYYVHLEPTGETSELEIESSYRRLDVPHILESVVS